METLSVDSAVNFIPKKLDSAVLKIWQRLCAARACFETFERQKGSNIDKLAYAEKAYGDHAANIVKEFARLAPPGLTVDKMCKTTVKGHEKHSGKSIWAIWESMNSAVKNEIIPVWLVVGPFNKDGSIKSGVQNYEEYYLKLRQRLYDMKKNSMSVLGEALKATAEEDNEVIEEVSSDSDEEIEAALLTTRGKRGRPAKVAGVRKDFDPNYFPPEWLAFIHHGPMSSNPYSCWSQYMHLSQGPSTVTPALIVSGRNDFKKKLRGEKRDVGINLNSSSPFSTFISSSNSATAAVASTAYATPVSSSASFPFYQDEQMEELRQDLKKVISAAEKQNRLVEVQIKLDIVKSQVGLSDEVRNKQIQDLLAEL